MTILTERFPPNISQGARGGPGFRTDVVVVSSGDELRNVTWAQARRRYDVAHAARLPADAALVTSFFHVCLGRAHSFRFKDWTDFSATISEGKFVSVAGANQMVKRYTVGSYTYDRYVTKPVSGTISITGGGTPDYTTGIVTGGSPTAWSGQFDVHCRFDADELTYTTISRSQGQLVIGWDSIPIVEVRG